MWQTFITGGSGFVGRNLIAALLSEGHQVRALVGTSVGSEAMRRYGGTPIMGELEDKTSLEEGMRDCDIVFHLAATVSAWADKEKFYHINVQGTENVISAARATRVPKLVHM